MWHRGLRVLILPSKNPSTGSLSALRMSRFFNSWGRWLETQLEGIKACIARTTKEKGHTTKQCRVLKDHLEQLVKARHLKEFVVGQEGGNVGQGLGSQGNRLPLPLGIIEVIITR